MKKKNSFAIPKGQKVLKYFFTCNLIALSLFGPAPSVQANTYVLVQNYSLNLSFKNERLSTVLDEISRQSGIKIAYSNAQIAANSRISVKVKTTSIEEALRVVLGDNYSYKQVEDYISIAKRSIDETSTKVTINQQKRQVITGLVTDSDGNPMIGVTVLEKGTTNGGITDLDGKYTIQVAIGKIIEFRYIGYNSDEIKVKGAGSINIRMVESSVSLDDVVIVGYGQQKKGSIVASVTTISAKELSMPTRNLKNNIAGQIAGVIAIQRSGEPGRDDSDFWIRGMSSFAGGTSPLVLVDGVPRSMNDIGVDEIETFTVLKDASATSVYGAEGANGVVLITSKRGSVQKPTLDIRTEFSMATPTRLPEMMNSYDYLSLYNEASWEHAGNPTSGFTNPYSNDILEMYRLGTDPDLYPNADFASLLKDNTANQRVTLNLRGGTERVRYFVSGAFYNESGLFDSKAIDQYDANIGFKRYNLRSNVDIDVTKTTVLTTDISGQYLDSSYPGKDTKLIFDNIYGHAPHKFPLIFSDGTFSENPRDHITLGNPYNYLNESGYSKNWQAFLQTKVALTQKLDFITKGLSVKGSMSFDANFDSKTLRSKTPTTFFMQLDENGKKEYIQKDEGSPNLSDPVDKGRTGEKRIYIEGSINYKRTFAEKHDVTGLILYMQKEQQTMGSGLPYRKQSVVARTTYGYDNRYMLEGSFGLTGSENFADGNRYGIFPAIGVAWYASNESFMKSMEDIISKLKFRISYGITGNDAIGGVRFPYRGLLKTNGPGYSLGFTGGSGAGGANSSGAGVIEDNFPAPGLSWEIEKKQNIGLDLGLLRGRIDISADYFSNERSNILMQRKTVSSVAGFRKSPWQNFGIVTNKGFDASLVVKQDVGDVKLSARANVTYAVNKIKEYDEVDPKYDYQRYTGNSLGTPRLYIADGLYKDTDFNIVENPSTGAKDYTLKEGLALPSANIKPGDIKYRDLNNDKKIDDYDTTYDHDFHSVNPQLVYGFGLNVEYKGFYTGIFFQGVGNVSMNLGGGVISPFTTNVDKAVRVEAADHWSSRNPENQDVLIPRLHIDQFAHNSFNSTWWYRKADFLRLKNLEFGYQFDKKMLSKANIKNARIYVQGNNIAVWDDINMWDPELGAAGATKYPISMTWSIGLELGF